MKFGVLGTGMVGQAIAGRLALLGHDVMMGSRDAKNEKAAAWAKTAGARASHGTFRDAAAFGDIAFNCTMGAASLDALKSAGEANLSGTILVDVSNPLDFSKGMPPSLFTDGRESLAEKIQKAFPKTRVVKALNTVNANVMVQPDRVPGDHDIFVCGDDAKSKTQVAKLLKDFGWSTVVDLGDLKAARGLEAYVLFWVQLWGALKTPDFNVKVVH